MICHSDAGNGPISASISLADALKTLANDSIQVSIMDVLNETTRLGFLVVRLYNYLLTQDLRWNAYALKIFYRSKTIKSGSLLNFSVHRLYTTLKRQEPDIIILTNPWIIGYVMTALQNFPNSKRPITVSLVIDIGHQSLPPSWYHPDIHTFIVPTSEAKQQLIQLGASAERVRVLGMPVHPAVLSLGNSIEKIRKESFDSGDYARTRETSRILVIGGREGTKNTFRIVERLLQLDFELRITVLCGKNVKLKRRLESLIARTHSHSNVSVNVEGFVQDMKHYMTDTDLIISKPGAMTVAEAIVMQIPMILDCDPIMMGQEIGNASFVVASQIGMIARSVEEIPHLVTKYLMDVDFRAGLIEDLKKVGTIGGTMKMAEFVLALSHSRSKEA